MIWIKRKLCVALIYLPWMLNLSVVKDFNRQGMSSFAYSHKGLVCTSITFWSLDVPILLILEIENLLSHCGKMPSTIVQLVGALEILWWMPCHFLPKKKTLKMLLLLSISLSANKNQLLALTINYNIFLSEVNKNFQ